MAGIWEELGGTEWQVDFIKTHNMHIYNSQTITFKKI